MIKFLIIASLIIYPSLSQGQDDEFQTIFRKNYGEKVKISGFAGPIMQFTSIEKEFSLMMGGGAAIMLGNVFFGGYGVGKSNEIPYKTDETHDLGFGHGGFWLGYIIYPKKPIHFSLSAQFGWGSITEKLKLPSGEFNNLNSDQITVITPMAEIEFNMSRFFKIGTGFSWSYVSGISNSLPYTTKDFSNPSINLTFKFGWFK